MALDIDHDVFGAVGGPAGFDVRHLRVLDGVGRVTGEQFGAPPLPVAAKVGNLVWGASLFFQRGGAHDFACASCHGEEGKRIRLQDLPLLTKAPGDGVGFAAWPAYRVSNGQMWSMQHA